MPVGSPQRRPRATGGGAPAGRAPPATEHACDMRPRAHNLHVVSCRRQRPIGQRSAAAHRPLQPRPFSEEGSQGSVLTEPISLRRSKRASPQVFPVHPRRRPQRGQLRSWSSRPPAPVVLAPTRSKWSSRPPAQHSRTVCSREVMLSTAPMAGPWNSHSSAVECARGPRVHPLQWSLRPTARSGPRAHPPESRGLFGRARSRCAQLHWLGRVASHQPARPISSPHGRPIGISHHRRRRRKAGISSRPVQCHRSGGRLAGTAGRGAVPGP